MEERDQAGRAARFAELEAAAADSQQARLHPPWLDAGKPA